MTITTQLIALATQAYLSAQKVAAKNNVTTSDVLYNELVNPLLTDNQREAVSLALTW